MCKIQFCDKNSSQVPLGECNKLNCSYSSQTEIYRGKKLYALNECHRQQMLQRRIKDYFILSGQRKLHGGDEALKSFKSQTAFL